MLFKSKKNIEVSRFYTFIHKILCKIFFRRRGNIFFKFIWKRLNKISLNYKGPIYSIIHGFRVIHNNGYTYPFTSRAFNTFNNPYLQLVYNTHSTSSHKLIVIDVGAAIGDTALFLLVNCNDAIDEIICIDGDQEFFSYLSYNSNLNSKIKPINCFLSDESKMESSLVRIHGGTASSQGQDFVEAISLDYLVFDKFKLLSCDVIKIDVDGFDGMVLKGCQRTLAEFKPSIIFEWHPILYKETHNDCLQPFHILYHNGYNKFVWFNKYGSFSHFYFDDDFECLKIYIDLALRGKFDNDWHYDIIAIHKDSPISLLELAEMGFAKRKKSPF